MTSNAENSCYIKYNWLDIFPKQSNIVKHLESIFDVIIRKVYK